MSADSICARLGRTYAGFNLDFNLELPGRGITALFGPSGSGKTTCLRCIAGLERAPGGFLSVNGEVWQDDTQNIFVPVHRRALGFVFQEASLFPHLSVAQNLDYGRRRRVGSAALDPAAMIALLGIRHLLDRRPQTLSGGERQRVAIARALLAGPRLLLLDEPLASLDLARKREILPYLERLHDTLDLPVLYVSHSPDEVARLADHLVLLEAGRVMASGPLATTLARLDLPASFADDAGTVIVGTVHAYDNAYRLLTLNFPGGSLRVIHEAVSVGRRLRVQIKARDVSLALQPPTGTSILNLLPATVTAEAPVDDTGHVLIGLSVGETPLTARITRFSRDQLNLLPGFSVYAQIKAVSVLT